MKVPNNNSSSFEETDADRRRGILDDNALSVDLASAVAGDRLLTEAEEHHLNDLRVSRGLRFFSDLLYSITHQFFPPEVAEDLWLKSCGTKISCRRCWEGMSGQSLPRWITFRT